MFTLVEERIRCLSNEAYPALDVNAALSNESFTDLLGLVGAVPGAVISENTEDRPSELIGDGEVRVFAPSPPVRYEPSASEVEFALVWVDCGEQIGFVDALNHLQVEPRAEILAQHELTILGLIEAIDALSLP